MLDKDTIISLANEAGIKGPAPARQGFKMYASPQRLMAFAALVAAAERESVATSNKRDLTCICGAVWDGEQMVHAPRKREWVGLTDEEISEIEDEYIVDYRIPAGSAWNFAKDLEAKLKEKNGG